MSQFSGFSTSAPATVKQMQRHRERQEQEQERETRESLIGRANAVTTVAQIVVAQNEQMLNGLRAASQNCSEPEPAMKVDFIARNMHSVSVSRSPIGRKEQALLARAQVMAAATTHIDAPGVLTRPTNTHSRNRPLPLDQSDDLVRAAREEVERGYNLTAFAAQTRRPPAKLKGLGRSHRAF